MRRFFVFGIAAMLFAVTGASAHHGTSISYLNETWKTDAVVVKFTYANPHPRLIFDRTNERGEVEHWESELISNPSGMMRRGWNKTRSEEAMKQGTKVRLTLSTSKANPRSAVIRGIENMNGEPIVTGGGPGAGQ